MGRLERENPPRHQGFLRDYAVTRRRPRGRPRRRPRLVPMSPLAFGGVDCPAGNGESCDACWLTLSNRGRAGGSTLGQSRVGRDPYNVW